MIIKKNESSCCAKNDKNKFLCYPSFHGNALTLSNKWKTISQISRHL